MKFHKFYAKIDILGKGTVTLDGVELACKGFTVDANVTRATTVTLTLYCDQLELDLETNVDMEKEK
jgi:hypothetical protein